mmetsp:Transcript_54188/g.168019  ORF Transcript_54188/g.168019 Transcript_54188/m.168019 type:complete len:207 (-) Transcript_54188:649-1269(-)
MWGLARWRSAALGLQPRALRTGNLAPHQACYEEEGRTFTITCKPLVPGALDEDEGPVQRGRPPEFRLRRGLGLALRKVRPRHGGARRGDLGRLSAERAGGCAEMGVLHLHSGGREGLRPRPPGPEAREGGPGGCQYPRLGPQPRRHAGAGGGGLQRPRGGQVHLGRRLPLVRRRPLRGLAAALGGALRGPAEGVRKALRAPRAQRL